MRASRRLAAVPLAVLLVVPPPSDAPAAAAGPAPSLFEELPWDPVGAGTPYAHFGLAVAPAGDVDHDGDGDVLVGAPGAGLDPNFFAGEVFLYEGSPQGLADVPSWSWSPPQTDAYAGSSLAPAGDVNGDGYHDVIVGVPGWNVGNAFGAGRVVLFHGGPSGLSATPSRDLLPPTPQNGQQFGFSVSTAGDVNNDGYDDVLVGAPSWSDGIRSFRGRAYVYLGGASGIAATPARTWDGAPQDGRFGYSVSSAGDFNADGYSDIVIAAPYEMNTFTEEGRVSLWFGAALGPADAPSSTTWGGSTQAFCGQSLSLAGDVNGDLFADVLVGLPSYHDATVARGKANVHFGNTVGLGAGTRVPDANDGALDEFGLVVATLGDLDGDGFADFGVRGNHLPAGDGRIAIFAGGPLGFEPMGEILAGTNDGFAYSFATSGDVDGDGRSEVLAGRALADVVIDAEEGRAALYRRTRVMPAPAPGWPLSLSAWGGLAIIPAYTGGFARLAVGEPSAAGDFGQVTLFTGIAEQGVNTSPAGSWTGGSEEEGFGARIVDAGDVNRDGLTDLVVSAPYFSGDFSSFSRGKVQFIPGTTGFLSAPVTFLVGDRSGDYVGLALAGRGDVNGDGYHDVLVGARECNSATKTDCGKVWLFLGAPGGPGAVAAWTREGDVTNRGLGSGVALGDIDGDGYSDVLVGSSTPESGAPPVPGRVEVFYGGPAGLPSTPGLVLTSLTPSLSFGEVVCALGDVTGDGICDVGVGSPRDGAGRVDLYEGTRGRSQSNIPWRKWLGTQVGARFGMALAGGGDVDGDGFGDFAIGEPWWDRSEASPDEGRVHLVHGAAGVPENVPGWISPSGGTAGRLGEAIAPLADLNGDGFADLAIAMPGGRVDVHLGGGGVGRRHRLGLEEPSLTQAWRYHPARLAHDMAVAVGIDLVHPAGRAKMTNQVELAAFHEPFTGVPTFSNSTYFTSGPSGSRVTTGVFAPWPSRAYRVRGRTISRSPYFQRSRWITPDAHTTGDHDLWLSGAVVDASPGPALGDRPAMLVAAAPNPSSGGSASRVSFLLAAQGHVTLAVHDVRGARVATLADGVLPAGRAEVAWNGRDARGRRAPAGVYFVVLTAGGASDRLRLVRLP